MENKEMMKQIIEFNKTTFNNSYDTAIMIGNQAERMTNSFMEAHPEILPEASKKMYDEWSASVKKGISDMQENINSGFSKFEDYFTS